MKARQPSVLAVPSAVAADVVMVVARVAVVAVVAGAVGVAMRLAIRLPSTCSRRFPCTRVRTAHIATRPRPAGFVSFASTFSLVCLSLPSARLTPGVDYLAAESQQHARPYDAYKFRCVGTFVAKRFTSLHSWAFRRTRLLREILSWHADIICLQEVDHFADYFEPELAQVHRRRS